MTKSVIELNSSINMLPGIGEKKVKLSPPTKGIHVGQVL